MGLSSYQDGFSTKNLSVISCQLRGVCGIQDTRNCQKS